MSRKVAPRIPKKPTNLTKFPEALHATELIERASRLSETQAQQTARNSQNSHQNKIPQYGPEHVTNKGDQGSRAGTDYSAVTMANIDRPSLPPRPNVDLLDQEEEDAKSIPSLKPLRLG